MPKYQKRPDLPYAAISGVGVLKDDRVIEGEFDAYVPGVLVRVSDSTPLAALVPAPAPEAPAGDEVPPAVSSDDGAAVVDVLMVEGPVSSDEVPSTPTKKFPKGKRR